MSKSRKTKLVDDHEVSTEEARQAWWALFDLLNEDISVEKVKLLPTSNKQHKYDNEKGINQNSWGANKRA